jgi:hypothetical protein
MSEAEKWGIRGVGMEEGMRRRRRIIWGIA